MISAARDIKKSVEGQLFLSWPFALLLAVLLSGAQAFLGRWLAQQATASVEPPASRRMIVPTALAKALAFGNEQVFVDVLLLRFLTDPAYAHVKAGEHPAGYYDLELATRLDPYFFDLYAAGSKHLSVIRNDSEGAAELIRRGVDVQDRLKTDEPGSYFFRYIWRTKWELPFMWGYLELFELQNLNRAAEAFRRTALAEGAPGHLKGLAESMSTLRGRAEVGFRILNLMISNATDDEVRVALMKKRDSLYLVSYLASLREGFRAFLKKQKGYQVSLVVPRDRLEKWFDTYLSQENLDRRDPVGGRVSLDSAGEIVTTTPHDKLMGLE